MNLNELFLQHGYLWVKAIIPPNELETVRSISIALKNRAMFNDLPGRHKIVDNEILGRSIEMASNFSSDLYRLYATGWMVDFAKQVMNLETIYGYNDQVVTKLPNENFMYREHTDNSFTPDPGAAQRDEYRTITCCWVLDDFNDSNGPISILDKETDEWITPMALAGDVLVWAGDTPHKSSLNVSDTARCVWLQIYATTDIINLPDVDEDFSRFHSMKL